MSRIWSMMDIGRQSLMNSQSGIQTVSHNIANKSTEGYSRQRVEQLSNPPVGAGKLRVGTGARASQVTRTNNPYLEKQLENERGQLHQHQAESQVLGRVEQVYNEQVNKGLNKYMGDFFNSFRELSNNPESLATRTLVKETADFMAKDFHRVHSQLTQIQEDADYQIVTLVSEVNEITKEIADLNEKIQLVEVSGGTANDERDRRELLLKQLGEKINIRYAESDNGKVNITAGNTAVLVSGYTSRDLVAKATSADDEKREGQFDIFYKSTDEATPTKITEQLTGGAIGGLLKVRDNKINQLLGDMDQMAYSLSTQVNKIHAKGFDRYNNPAGAFFKGVDQVKGAANKIAVNDFILDDVGSIAAAARPNAPGDNRIANVISSLQYQKVMSEGVSTFDDFYATIVGKVGIEAAQANKALESQGSVVAQLNKIRESISGVSLDEETTRLIEFQKQFDASARLIRAADEMMETVINIKRY